MKYKTALHIFRRDLRLYDNSALIYALEKSQRVMPCFILDPHQVKENSYKSDRALLFMFNSLIELDAELRSAGSRLYLFEGLPEEVMNTICKSIKIDLVSINRDYTPFALRRDKGIERVCNERNISFNISADALLNEPETILKNDNTPFSIFSFYKKRAMLLPVKNCVQNTHFNYFNDRIDSSKEVSLLSELLPSLHAESRLNGGRKEAHKLLKNIENLKDYDSLRDFPAENCTTLLSAHNKFGTISVRELFSTVKNCFNETHQLISELYWRDFFTQLAFHFPYVFGSPFHKKYLDIKWQSNPDYFQRWQNGLTGFPIVDAGMRELNSTGFMHNRARLITASFLVKDLQVDWREGEKYFARKLIDYDPAVNNGNWQWTASTGADAQPYFRIFNPWTQQKKFDPDCLYIRKWIPELSKLSDKEIHNLEFVRPSYLKEYPTPMVNHKEASALTKIIYKV